MIVEEIKCAFYENPFGDNFKELTISHIIELFKGDCFKPLILRARDLYLSNRLEDYTLHKSRLPAITFSGIFTPKRRISLLQSYTGLIILDIDKLGIDLVNVLNDLRKDPYILSIWKSPSGDGLKFLIHTQNEVLYHKETFKAAEKYYSEKYKLAIDASGSDVSRLCFVSYDPAVKMNVSYKMFNFKEPVLKSKPKDMKTVAFMISKSSKPSVNNVVEKELFKKVLHFLKKRNLSITENYTNWVRVGFAISNTFTYDLGRRYFMELCSLDGARNDTDESSKLIDNCYRKGLSQSTFGTILHLAKDKGFDVDLHKKEKKR